jgi:glutamine synthetase
MRTARTAAACAQAAAARCALELGLDQRARGLVRPARQLRGKTLMAAAGWRRRWPDEGIGLVSTLLLKDSADRTALPVFEPGAPGRARFWRGQQPAAAARPRQLLLLPWAPGTAWLRASPGTADGTARWRWTRGRCCSAALARLAEPATALRCGLEVEFHVYRIAERPGSLDPARPPGRPSRRPCAAAPGLQPAVRSLGRPPHEALAIVRAPRWAWACRCARWRSSSAPASSRPCSTPCDALTAADQMVLFRNGVRQALRRAGYHASFMCRPPFANAMASGWHLHQSLATPRAATPLCASGRAARPAAGAMPAPCCPTPARTGWPGCWRMPGLARCRVPTASTASPASGQRDGAAGGVHWGATTAARCCACWAARATPPRASRTASASRMANPYLCHGGAGAGRPGRPGAGLQPGPPATDDAYATPPEGAPRLPASLLAGARRAAGRPRARRGPGRAHAARLRQAVKRAEAARRAEAADADDWERREYFSRF